MEGLIIILVLINILIAHNGTKRELDIINMITIEDKVRLDLDKPLTIKEYRKVFKHDYIPYEMVNVSRTNKILFKRFEEFISDIEDINKIENLNLVSFFFVNKIDGYETNGKILSIISDETKGSFITMDEEVIHVVKDIVPNMTIEDMLELSIGGIFTIGRHRDQTRFLDDLTSVHIIHDEDFIDKDKITSCQLLFVFGSEYIFINFYNVRDALDYLFGNEDSDIRLIQKISNTAVIFTDYNEGDVK